MLYYCNNCKKGYAADNLGSTHDQIVLDTEMHTEYWLNSTCPECGETLIEAMYCDYCDTIIPEAYAYDGETNGRKNRICHECADTILKEDTNLTFCTKCKRILDKMLIPSGTCIMCQFDKILNQISDINRRLR